MDAYELSIEPGVSGQDWLAGKDGQVPKLSLRPGQHQSPQQTHPNTTPAPASTPTSAPVPTPAPTPASTSTPTPVPAASQEKTENSNNTQKNDTKPETIPTNAKPVVTDKPSETPSQQPNIKPKVLPKYGAAKINSFKYIYGKLIHPSYDDLRDLSIDKAGISELIQVKYTYTTLSFMII